jgi:Male sterility protein.
MQSFVNFSYSEISCPVSVTCAWKEPIPGWTCSKNGPTGFLMGAAKGVVRRLPVNREVVYDYIPVDIVINELIVAAWNVGTTRYAFISHNSIT